MQLFRPRINIIKVCKGANKGHLGGLDKVFKIRDHHHRTHRQILRPNDCRAARLLSTFPSETKPEVPRQPNEGLILILAQS